MNKLDGSYTAAMQRALAESGDRFAHNGTLYLFDSPADLREFARVLKNLRKREQIDAALHARRGEVKIGVDGWIGFYPDPEFPNETVYVEIGY